LGINDWPSEVLVHRNKIGITNGEPIYPLNLVISSYNYLLSFKPVIRSMTESLSVVRS